jgi:guanylate kinase
VDVHPPTLLLILAGPAGAGKSTLCERLIKEVPGIERVITATTRPPRAGEVNGRDYHFLTPEQFDAKLAAGEFLEWAWVHRTHRYGTLKSAVLDRLPHTHLVINVDVQGVRSIRHAAADDPVLHSRLLTVFVAPDSLEELRRRLAYRGKDDDAEIARRLQTAVAELEEKSSYDYFIPSRSKEEDFRALLGVWEQARRKFAPPAA